MIECGCTVSNNRFDLKIPLPRVFANTHGRIGLVDATIVHDNLPLNCGSANGGKLSNCNNDL